MLTSSFLYLRDYYIIPRRNNLDRKKLPGLCNFWRLSLIPQRSKLECLYLQLISTINIIITHADWLTDWMMNA